MLFPNSRKIGTHLLNLFGALCIGLFLAYIGLNAASGCGQGGQCIRLHDLTASEDAPTPPPTQLAERFAPPLRRP